jgi:hypothetical protein
VPKNSDNHCHQSDASVSVFALLLAYSLQDRHWWIQTIAALLLPTRFTVLQHRLTQHDWQFEKL